MSEWDGNERRCEWYSGRDFLEMIGNLETKLTNTINLISKYNGLLERQTAFETRLTSIEKCIENKDNITEYKKGISLNIRSWWPVARDIMLLGIIPLLIYILKVVSELR